MATVDIAIAGVSARTTAGVTLPVIDPIPIDTDLITSSGTSQQSDFTVPTAPNKLYWVIAVKSGDVRAKFGDNPTAVNAEGGGWLLFAGQTYSFGATPGHKVAIIDA